MSSVGKILGVSAAARIATLPVTATATIITTYLVVKDLGLENYAYVVLVGALFQLIPFADLGMGAAVVNASSRRLESRESSAIALATAGMAFRTLAFSALAIVSVTTAISLMRGWPSLLGLSADMADSSHLVVPAVLLPFALSIPFGIGQRILIGEGRNHVASIVGIAGPVAAAGATYILLQLGVPPLLLGIATPFGILVVSVWCFFLALKISGWHFRQIISIRQLRRRPKLWNSAFPMMVISITVPLALQSDRLVLSHLSEPLELSEYSVAAQMYVPMFSVISMAAVALWPIFARSGSASLPLWTKALTSLGTGGCVLAIIFALLVGPVARLITEGKLSIGGDLALAFASLLVVMACHQASAVLLTSPSQLSFQAVCSTGMLILNISLSVFMAPIYGASGVVWASAIAVFIAQLIPCLIKAQIFLRQSRESILI